jgi:hypothetical protein
MTEREEIHVDRILEAPTTVEAKYVKMSNGIDQYGIAIRGAKYVVPLPRGYTEHCQVCDFFGSIIVSHVGLPTLLIDGEHGRAVEVDFARIQREARELRTQ